VKARARAAYAAALLCVTAGLVGCTAPGDDEDNPLVVETEHGKVKGIETDGIRAWRGIPYAAPPVGDLRWEPPEEPDDWGGVRKAANFGATCIQGGPTPGQTGVTTAPNSAEDCLYLNVNAPKKADGLPVMVWLHGGGFVVGTGSHALSNSPAMVKRGVVLVTLNYRLGRFGFFAHPALEGSVANFGLLDQVAALEWVQDNIDEFGGNPDNVTIFGQSAGGMSVNALMTSPAAEGLFDKAISQSGLGRERSISLDEARADGEQFLPDLDADQLRQLEATRILGPPQDVLGGELPIVDEVLPQRVADAFAAGDEADVPYLVGTTDAEFPDSFLQALGRPPDAARAVLVGGQRDAFVSVYGGELALRQHLISDAIFTEPARFLAVSHADRAPTYRYRFSITAPDRMATVGGAAHSEDGKYVFDQAGEKNRLADQICDYWVSFATTGDPNHPGAPEWPTADGDALIEFTTGGPVAEAPDPWDARLDAVQTANERLS
jgi:para-nitrobenzyl esterase